MRVVAINPASIGAHLQRALRPTHHANARRPSVLPLTLFQESAMFIVTNRVPVAPAWRDQFEARFRARAGQVESQPGFVRMEVLRPQDETTPYVVETAWESRAAFDAWLESDDFKAAHANPLPKEAYDGEGRLESFDVIISAVAEQPKG
jgi:heme-degrading monooxygenase HmoA